MDIDYDVGVSADVDFEGGRKHLHRRGREGGHKHSHRCKRIHRKDIDVATYAKMDRDASIYRENDNYVTAGPSVDAGKGRRVKAGVHFEIVSRRRRRHRCTDRHGNGRRCK